MLQVLRGRRRGPLRRSPSSRTAPAEHERTIREFRLSQRGGLQIGEPLADFEGVLERHAALRGYHQDDGRQPANERGGRHLRSSTGCSFHAPRGRDAQVVLQVLHAHAMHPEVCGLARAAPRALQAGAGLAFVTEESLGGPALEPLTDWVAHQPPWSDFPFIVLVARRVGRRPSAATGALGRLGNVVLLERPLNTETLVSAARSALRGRERQYQTRRHLIEQEEARAIAERHRQRRGDAAPTRRSSSRSMPPNSAPSTARCRSRRSYGTRSARSTSGFRPVPRSTSIASIRLHPRRRSRERARGDRGRGRRARRLRRRVPDGLRRRQ